MMSFAPHCMNGEIIAGGSGCAGTIGMNVPKLVPMALRSFGGRMQSLFGDHHVHGLKGGVRFR